MPRDFHLQDAGRNSRDGHYVEGFAVVLIEGLAQSNLSLSLGWN